MKRPLEIMAEENAMRTVVGLTSAFESVSSMKIMMTKRGVLSTNAFFDDIWSINAVEILKIEPTTATVSKDLTLSEDLIQASTKYHYWGSESVDGSTRISNSSGEMVFESRVSGTWIEIGRFTP
jgi:hypothetical protein